MFSVITIRIPKFELHNIEATRLTFSTSSNIKVVCVSKH